MKGVTDEVRKDLQCVEWYSFTTDIWSTEVSSDCLLSLTVHWLTKKFEKKEAVLHAQPLPGRHTGEVLSMNTTICWPSGILNLSRCI